MSDWGWVALAYVTVFGTLTVYGMSVRQRIRALRGPEDR